MKRDRLGLISILIAVGVFILMISIIFARDIREDHRKGYTIEYLAPDRIAFIDIHNPRDSVEAAREAIMEISKKYDIASGSFTITEYIGYGSATGGIILFLTPKL